MNLKTQGFHNLTCGTNEELGFLNSNTVVISILQSGQNVVYICVCVARKQLDFGNPCALHQNFYVLIHNANLNGVASGTVFLVVWSEVKIACCDNESVSATVCITDLD
jgi:hypothetical protein